MTLPPLLSSLLTTHGPSGYEQAPAKVWRDAASRVQRRRRGRRDGQLDGARAGHRRRPVAGDRRPRRRDRPDRHAHRGLRLPALHRRRRLGHGDPDRPAPRARDQGRADPGGRRQEADPPAQAGRPQEGPRDARAAHRHRRRGRRRGALAGADRRRRGDRRRPDRAARRPRDLALDGQPARLLRRLRGGAARRRGRRRGGRRDRGGGGPGGDRPERRAHDGPPPAPGPRDRGRRHARDRRAGHRRGRDRAPPSRLGPRDRARHDDPSGDHARC